MEKVHITLHVEYDINKDEIERFKQIYECINDDQVIGVIKGLTTMQFDEFCESDELRGRNPVFDLKVEAIQ